MTIRKGNYRLWAAVTGLCMALAMLAIPAVEAQATTHEADRTAIETAAERAGEAAGEATVETAQAGGSSDSLAGGAMTVSLLTCAAGEEIYSLFGHSAIRVEIPAIGVDEVYNYGMFDFAAPNFILRFALGKTDYQLGRNAFPYFAAEYAYLGRAVWQQILNLTPVEKERLLKLLEVNYLPPNRTYRYNFFYDNCATRPRDLIERCLEEPLVYYQDMTDTHTGTTFRDLLHLYSKGHPWSRFGMDLCMGPLADREISRRTMMFVPFHVQEEFRTARVVYPEGGSRPLVAREGVLVPVQRVEKPGEGFTPLHAALLLLAATLAVTLYGYRHGRSLWGVDVILFSAAGLAGCILAFLAIFSQHPAVSPNYLLFVFHPLHLLCLPCALKRVARHKLSRYMLANAIVLTLFILLWAIIPQRFPIAVLPLALCLLVRSAYHIRTLYTLTA